MYFFLKKDKPSIDERLMYLIDDNDDFELCDNIYSFIVEKYNNNFDIKSCEPHEQVVVLVWHASGIIGNGGFEYLFEGEFQGDPYFELTIDAFQKISVNKAVTAFNKAFQYFPNNKPPKSISKRMDLYQNVPESERDKINSEFWSVCNPRSDELESKLAAFIRQNRYKFGYQDSSERVLEIKKKHEASKPLENKIIKAIETKDYLNLKSLLDVKKDLVNAPGNAKVKNLWGKDEFEVMLPIQYAVYQNDIKAVEILISYDVNMEVNDQYKNTVLHDATMNGFTDIVLILINHDVGINLKNSNGITPLMVAARNDRLDCVKVLLESGADPKVLDEDGANCLYNIRRTKIAEILIESGAEVNNVAIDGDTPLHVACINKFVDLSVYFISKGADLKVKNKEGKTPIDIAKENGIYGELKNQSNKANSADAKSRAAD